LESGSLRTVSSNSKSLKRTNSSFRSPTKNRCAFFAVVALDDEIFDLCFPMWVAELPPGEGPEDDYRRLCNELMRVTAFTAWVRDNAFQTPPES
jgi:hypothetical protein